MTNKQPYYHSVMLLFTGTQIFTPQQIVDIFQCGVANLGISDGPNATLIMDSIVVEECDAEPGDPHDLMG